MSFSQLCCHPSEPDSHVVCVYVSLSDENTIHDHWLPCQGIWVRPPDVLWRRRVASRANDHRARPACFDYHCRGLYHFLFQASVHFPSSLYPLVSFLLLFLLLFCLISFFTPFCNYSASVCLLLFCLLSLLIKLHRKKSDESYKGRLCNDSVISNANKFCQSKTPIFCNQSRSLCSYIYTILYFKKKKNFL